MAEFPHIFIQAPTREAFEAALTDGRVSQHLVAFIEDTHEIWARGKYYPCPYTKAEIDLMIENLDDSKVDLDTYNAAIEKLENSLKEFPVADEEDITVTADNKFQLKDRDTYKILRLPENGILTQDMINEPNTIYEIRYNFDLNGATINIPENCTLRFLGGSVSNGKLNVGDTVTLDQGNYCFRNISFLGKIKNTLLASSFGETVTVSTLQSIIDNTPRDFLNLEIDTSVNFDSSLHILDKYYSTITFKLRCYTSINDGSAALIIEGGIQSSVSGFYLTNLDKTILNNIGIQISTKTNYLSINDPSIEYSKIGISFGSESMLYSTYLARLNKVWIKNCLVGIKIFKGLEGSWCNGVSILPLDISENNIGIDCESGLGNSIYCTNTELGHNNIGIRISGGSYNIIGNQWNENSQNAIVLEGGFTTFVGDTGIYSPGSFKASKEAAYSINKLTSSFANRTILDNTKLVADILFSPNSTNSIKNLVSGDLVEVEDGNIFLSTGENGYSLKGSNYLNNSKRLTKTKLPLTFNFTKSFSIVLKYHIIKNKELSKESSEIFQLTFQNKINKNFLAIVPRIDIYNEGTTSVYAYSATELIDKTTFRETPFNNVGCIALSYDAETKRLFSRFGDVKSINIPEELAEDSLYLDILNLEDDFDACFESLKIYNTCLSANLLALLGENIRYQDQVSWKIIR